MRVHYTERGTDRHFAFTEAPGRREYLLRFLLGDFRRRFSFRHLFTAWKADTSIFDGFVLERRWRSLFWFGWLWEVSTRNGSTWSVVARGRAANEQKAVEAIAAARRVPRPPNHPNCRCVVRPYGRPVKTENRYS